LKKIEKKHCKKNTDLTQKIHVRKKCHQIQIQQSKKFGQGFWIRERHRALFTALIDSWIDSIMVKK
jgi:hypothetical protein